MELEDGDLHSSLAAEEHLELLGGERPTKIQSLSNVKSVYCMAQRYGSQQRPPSGKYRHSSKAAWSPRHADPTLSVLTRGSVSTSCQLKIRSQAAGDGLATFWGSQIVTPQSNIYWNLKGSVRQDCQEPSRAQCWHLQMGKRHGDIWREQPWPTFQGEREAQLCGPALWNGHWFFTRVRQLHQGRKTSRKEINSHWQFSVPVSRTSKM